MPEEIIPPTGDGNLADEIFGVSEYKPEQPVKREFLPWHRPRKQFVRAKQWTKLIDELVNDHTPDDSVIKYLGLPGDDLLDLRFFHENICVKRNLFIKFIGFNNSGTVNTGYDPSTNVSIDEIVKLRFIHQGSKMSADNITEISVENSIAWRDSFNMSPFDVVNLDLCDGFGKHPITDFHNSHYNTLKNILAMQSKAKKPWLLFLTTRTNKECINDALLIRLRELYENNLAECLGFQDASRERLQIGDLHTLQDAMGGSKGVSDVFLVSLCKWIAKLSVTQNPPTKLSVKNVLGYRVSKAAEYQDIISIAIKFTPLTVTTADPLGIATNAAEVPSECEMAVQALNQISNQKDVDGLLRGNLPLKETMITETCNLLDEARYDITGYKAWLESVEHAYLTDGAH
jgi:hypothetical protein